jgi:D-tyrosyl-tRNA(Tyr) deacylase
MRIVVQRVSKSSVEIDNKIHSQIDKGLLVLVGVEDEDDRTDVDWLCGKVLNLRVFDDENGVMNKSVVDIDGELLLVSQFTLHASTRKGNRPSYIKAARPEYAIPLYSMFCQQLEIGMNKPVKTGVFGANMQVTLVNDGPVTIIIDSKNKE